LSIVQYRILTILFQLYPNYYDVIQEPIDLKMIAKKVMDNEYRTPDDMDREVTLMVNNAKTFNEPKSTIYKVIGTELSG